MTITLSPGLMLEISISKASLPYSKSYSSEITLHGNLPFFLNGTNEIFNFSANNAPNINPLASIQQLHLYFYLCIYHKIYLLYILMLLHYRVVL